MINELNESDAEKRPIGQKASSSRQLVILGVTCLIFAIWAIVNQVRNQNLNNRLSEIESTSAMTLDSLRAISETMRFRFDQQYRIRDSLERILRPLEPYRPLVGMLNYRDSVQASLPFVSGDRVLVLPDSIPAIVKQVLLTGSGNSFSIDYIVVLKGGVERSVPSLLLEKK